MMRKYLIFMFLIVIAQTVSSQDILNNYKYVIVPKQFEFQTGQDSYQVNSLTKYLLDKKGFNTIFSDEVLPEEVIRNQCLALKVSLIESSNFTRTKMKLSFLNCQNQVVFESEYGISKSKDFKQSYHEAIRAAFKDLDNFRYRYKPKNIEITEVVAKLEEVNESVPVNKQVIIKPYVEDKTQNIIEKKDVIIEKPLVKVKYETTLVGLYQKDQQTFEIAAFQNYFIFSEQIKKGNDTKTKPLGFIYNTSRKGNYLVKTTDTFVGYLLENGNFIIDKINTDGILKTSIYQKIKN